MAKEVAMTDYVAARITAILENISGHSGIWQPGLTDFDPMTRFEMDSIIIASFCIAVHEEFGIHFGEDNRDLEAMSSFLELVSVVAARLTESGYQRREQMAYPTGCECSVVSKPSLDHQSSRGRK